MSIFHEFSLNLMVWWISTLATYYFLATDSLHSAWIQKPAAIFPCSNDISPRKNVAVGDFFKNYYFISSNNQISELMLSLDFLLTFISCKAVALKLVDTSVDSTKYAFSGVTNSVENVGYDYKTMLFNIFLTIPKIFKNL